MINISLFFCLFLESMYRDCTNYINHLAITKGLSKEQSVILKLYYTCTFDLLKQYKKDREKSIDDIRGTLFILTIAKI